MSDQIFHMKQLTDGMHSSWLIDKGGEEKALVVTLLGVYKEYPVIISTTFGKVTDDKLLDIVTDGVDLTNDDYLDEVTDILAEDNPYELYPNRYDDDGDRLCEGCLEPLGDHTMRWCQTCELVYNAGRNER